MYSEEEIAFVRQTVEELDAVKFALEQEQIRCQVGAFCMLTVIVG